MRRCPYCAEDIADDATRCPHCDSDLTASPAGASSAYATQPLGPPAGVPPAADAGAVQFSYSGQRYLLGYGSDFFGIWDRVTPGPPVERFPRTDGGWAQAWTRYSALEPASQPVQAAAPVAAGAGGSSGAPSGYGGAGYAPAPTVPWGQQAPPVYYVPQQQRTNGLAVASLVLGILGLFLFGFVAIPPVLALIFGLVAMGQIRRATPGTLGGQGMAIAGIVLGGVGILFFVIWIIAIANGARPGF